MRKGSRRKGAASKSRLSQRREHCANPWNGECEGTDIELYILYDGNRLPICRSCWGQIADRKLEWGEEYGF